MYIHDDVWRAIREIADFDPMHDAACGDIRCFFCDAPSAGTGYRVDHEPDCVWVSAHEILGRLLPSPHIKGK